MNRRRQEERYEEEKEGDDVKKLDYYRKDNKYNYKKKMK